MPMISVYHLKQDERPQGYWDARGTNAAQIDQAKAIWEAGGYSLVVALISDDLDLDRAFRITNSVDKAWYKGLKKWDLDAANLEPYVGGIRSTSVGDVMEIHNENGELLGRYVVLGIGFGAME